MAWYDPTTWFQDTPEDIYRHYQGAYGPNLPAYPGIGYPPERPEPPPRVSYTVTDSAGAVRTVLDPVTSGQGSATANGFDRIALGLGVAAIAVGALTLMRR